MYKYISLIISINTNVNHKRIDYFIILQFTAVLELYKYKFILVQH